MGQKHLHELLKEDQEPFHLKTFISDHRSKLISTITVAGKTEIIVKKQKPIIKPTGRNFCINHVCLFTSADSPEFRNSPFLDFPTRELKSPCNNNNNATVFLNIPAMLLEAATRVHKPEPGTKFKFGLFGSFLRRLKDRSIRTKRCEIGPVNGTTSSSPAMGRMKKKKKKSVNGGVKLSKNSSEESSEISLEMEASCTLRSVHEFEELDYLCSNPSSPFRFSLHKSPSPTRRKFDSSSPVASPNRHFRQDKESYEVGCKEEVNRENNDEKEQCSPVSILDPVFVDDEEERDGGVTEEDGYDIECCYANVQRAKHQLLQKLKRFERLAGLDPIDLESRMFDQCSNEDADVLTNEEEMTNDECFREIVNSLGVGKIPWYMKKLVLDLIDEENKNAEDDMIVQRVCKRLYMWKVVDLNTIDMIVETDFVSEGWKWCDKETIRDMGADIAMAIFGFLMEELEQELVL